MSRQSLKPSSLLALALAGTCAVLVLVLAGQRWLAGGEPDLSAIQISPPGNATPSSLETRRFELPPKSEYAQVTARPLFNEDRRPEQLDETEQPDGEIAAAEEASSELPPVSLTGVIITPEQRIAMLQHNQNREYVTLKVGEPLEGWTLDEVEHRRIVFSAGGRKEVVELEVYTGNLGGGRGRGGGRREQPGGNGAEPAGDESGQPLSATEQIRERIERERERRRELIEEARKRSRERNAESDQ